MSETTTLPPPSVEPREIRSAKWNLERAAFRQLLPDLVTTHGGQYVAIHEGRIVGSGSDKLEVALDALAKVGNVDIYVGLVSNAPIPIVRSGVRRVVPSGGDA